MQPYIDVTTHHDKTGKKTHIGRFIGWMGFDDAPRPVIGKHGDYWLCLHECPDGEKPGVIADIAEWTGKRGWPMPTPYFPNCAGALCLLGRESHTVGGLVQSALQTPATSLWFMDRLPSRA